MWDFWFFQKLTNPLVLFGFAGQTIFMMRFVVQWFVSEVRGRSTVPLAFWYISVFGGVMLFTYALLNQDPVIMFGQVFGLLIYVRNIYMIHARHARYRRRRKPQAAIASSASDEGSGTIRNT